MLTLAALLGFAQTSRGIMGVMSRSRSRLLLLLSIVMSLLGGCSADTPPSLPDNTAESNKTEIISTQLPKIDIEPTILPSPTALPTPLAIYYSPGLVPTPDPPKPIKDRGTITITYAIQRGDTLSGLSQQFDVSEEDLRSANQLTVRQANRLRTGDTILVPIPVEMHAPSVKLIPDSELVNSPSAINFDIAAQAHRFGGYLDRYTERVDGDTLTGPQIVQRVADQFSVHPRLLLAALEYTGGWMTNATPSGDALLYPLGYRRTNLSGLFIQLNWAAARLNEGYYGWRLDNRYIIRFDDGGYAFVGNNINAGTAGLQNYLGAISTQANWQDALGERGFVQTYRNLFGDPWQFNLGELVPTNLRQPELRLPFAKGELWYFTGGPHSSWGRGSPWGALDFASANVMGCDPLRNDWVMSMAEGRIVRSVHGEVAQSLDPRQDERVGWSVLYMHTGTPDRVSVGTWLKAGERIGHPSCEGGFAPAAHTHVARKYNGEWINATGTIPFTLSGWRASESTNEYDGFLVNGPQRREACDCKSPGKNGVQW